MIQELFETILWNEVRSLGDAPVQLTLGSEWKTWKQEVMKWFSTSHPVSTAGDVDHRNSDGPSNTNIQVSRKGPKLEVRRVETALEEILAKTPLRKRCRKRQSNEERSG